MSKICSAREAAAKIENGMTIMVGGFLNVGTPEQLIDALLKTSARQLTLIANDGGFPGKGVGRLLDERRLAKVHTSYVGTHGDYGRCMENGELELLLTPQGTLAEQIRSAGAGIGGFLTPTGVGTSAEQGKRRLQVGGRDYLLEYPLKADVALIKAQTADTSGNLQYRRCARNFNPLMATAAELVIVEVEEVVPVGSLDPDQVMTPGIFVDFIVKGGDECDCE